MAIVTIDGNTVPSSMSDRGDFSFPRAEQIAVNGQGVGIASPVRAIEWKFAYMTATELAFWTTTVLGGAASKFCDGTLQIKDPQAGGSTVTFTSCVVDEPDVGYVRGGLYRDVAVTVRNVLG